MYGVAALEYAFPLKEVVADEPLAIEAVVCVPYDTELAAYLKVLNKFRRDIEILKDKEEKKIKPILDWVKKRQKNINTS